MVQLIIAAAVGAGVIVVLLAAFGLFKAWRNSKITKLTSVSNNEQLIEDLRVAAIAQAKHSGLSHSEPILKLEAYEVDTDTLQQLKLNSIAEKGKVSSDKLTKKANKLRV